MGGKNTLWYQWLLFMLIVGFAASTTFITESVLKSDGSTVTGRSLLQTRTNCAINFEFMNYTIITSKCKGPRYPVKECCESLTEFACPYTESINDATNDCASIMFSYINLYGKYPPGLFANECKGDKKGLVCPDNSTMLSEKDSAEASSGCVGNGSFFVLIGVLCMFSLSFLY